MQNLIHPSLYCYPLKAPRTGQPYLLGKACVEGTFSDNEGDEEDEYEEKDHDYEEYSWQVAPQPLDPLWHCVLSTQAASTFQWLPSNVWVSPEGGASFSSYINNMPATHAETMTPVLEGLLSLAIPRWEQVISHPDGSAAYSLRGRELQVIVKAANYILQPGETHEGSW